LAVQLARGVALLCLLGPFEGWDEYQHLAYFEHLARHGEPPRLGVAKVHGRLLHELPAWPAPLAMTTQFSNGGVVSYADRYAGKGVGEIADPPPLYQAQHSPIYYLLHLPVYGFAVSTGSLLDAVAILRFVNLLWSAVASISFALLLRRLHTPVSAYAASMALLALHPLWLMNAVRVSNDASAIALAFLGLLAIASGPNRLGCIFFGAMLLGLAGAVKATAWAAAPLGLIAAARLGTPNLRSIAVYALVVGGCFLGALLWNQRIHGLYMPTQESYHIQQAGKGLEDVLKSAGAIDWPREWERRLGRELVFVGGWSFAPIPKALRRVLEWLSLCTLLLGAIRAFGSMRRHSLASSRMAMAVVGWISILLAMSWHMAQTHAAFGFVGTPVWYAAIALPWLFLAVAESIPPRFRKYGIAVWALSFMIVEMTGWWSLATIQADSTTPTIVLERLAGLHPAWLPPAVGIAAWLAAAFGAATLLLRFPTIPNERRDELRGGS
jgi:hypothetical protein